jgi:hypothetical protein
MAWVRPTVEFSPTTNPLDAPVWVDISDDIRGPLQWGYGRSSEFDQANPGQASFTLDNRTRKYDPLNTAGPYYGDLLPRRKVRVTVSGTTVFTGYVTGWNQSSDWVNGDATVEVTAVDPLTVLAQVKFPADIYHNQMRKAAPIAWWRLLDLGSTLVDQMDNMNATAYGGKYDDTTDFKGPFDAARYLKGAQGHQPNDYIYLNDGPGTGNPFGSYTGPSSIEFWIWVDHDNMASPGLGHEEHILRVDNNSGQWDFILSLHDAGNGNVRIQHMDNDWDMSNKVLLSKTWTHFVMVTDGTDLIFYQDGELAGQWAHPTSNGGSGSIFVTLAQSYTGFRGFVVGGTQNIAPVRYGFRGWLRDLALYDRALTAQEVRDNYAATQGYGWELPGVRVERILDLVGWPDADRVIDQGNGIASPQDRPAGYALSYLQDIAIAEGGLLYAQPDGKIRFRARHYGNDDTASKTVQAVYDDSSTATLRFERVQPAWDDAYIFNEVTASSGDGVAVTLEDPASIEKYLRRTHDSTGLKTSDPEAYGRAEGILRRYANPGTQEARNKAINLAAGTNYAIHTLASNLNAGLTVAAWCKPLSLAAGTQAVFAFNTSSGNNGCEVFYGNGGVSRFTLFHTSPDTFINEVASGRTFDIWYHLIMTLTLGGTLTLYVDNVQVAQATGINATNQPIVNNTLSLGQEFDGAGVASNLFKGMIDEALVFNRVITSGERATLAAASSTKEGQYVNDVLTMLPWAWWRLDETAGTIMNDSSGNARHGVYMGAPTLGLDGVVPGPQAGARLEEVVINARHSTAQLDDAIARRIGDRVQVNWKQNAQGTQVEYQGHIEAYKHEVDFSELTWRFTFMTQPQDLELYFKADTHPLGTVILGH